MDFKTAFASELKRLGTKPGTGAPDYSSDAGRPPSRMDPRSRIRNNAKRGNRRDRLGQRAYDAAILRAQSNDPKNPGGDQGEYEGARRAMKLRGASFGRSPHGGRRGLNRMSGGY
jgi:hypothetical protein